jgi:hypothetical protein
MILRLSLAPAHDVRFGVRCGRKWDIAPSPLSADSFAKVPKHRATKFPLNDKTNGISRSM